MKIKNVRVYGLQESIKRSGYPMQIGEPEELPKQDWLCSVDDYARAKRLANTPSGSGHNNFLIGITVQFDLQYPQYWTKHLQRYHWFQYFSGQSLMHKLTSVNVIADNCNKYVLPQSTALLESLIQTYNNFNDPDIKDELGFEYGIRDCTKNELFHYIISNCPMGYELWVPVTTNYMQLKTIYHQRRSHKLEDWQQFCDFIESLPMSELITGKYDRD